MASPTLQRIVAVTNSILSPANVSKVTGKIMQTAGRVQDLAVRGYKGGRMLMMGPVRNGILVGREFVEIVAKERQMTALPKGLWVPARQRYTEFFEKVFPLAMRQEGQWVQAAAEYVKHLNWKQVGAATLIVGEVASLYYMSKLATITSKKSIQSLF